MSGTIRHALGTAAALLLLCGGGSRMTAQTVSYILPDVGTPGHHTAVEFVAPASATGSFGVDGLYANVPGDAVRIVTDDPADTALVRVGPVVVSWSGRLAATHVFVQPGVDPGTWDWRALDSAYIVPLRIVVNGTPSNREFFFIVRPQPALIASGGGTIGTGALGRRSRRGAMIVDSISLDGGTWLVDTSDPDPVTPGNQGFLPFVLISRGRVTGGNGALLSVASRGKDGGPGGGGGGGNFCDFTGEGSDGGNGFTGGGPGGRNRSGNPFAGDLFKAPGTGTGPVVAGTGGSLNGVAGSNAPWYEASGGGTGHPFGNSGTGCNDGPTCSPPGGFGGGSGQQQTLGGGGGGYATAGQSSNAGNGGQVHGNRQLVPLAGGSGGASGNPQGPTVCSGEGGGGGGALRFAAPAVTGLSFSAAGGDGQERSNGPGGSGSGGGLSIETKMMYASSSLNAAGGSGGIDGGSGRLRLDGPRNTISLTPASASNYRGPSTDTSYLVARTFTITGTGNGEDIRLYLASESMPWTRIATVSAYFGNFWSENITLPGSDELYHLVAVQQVSFPQTGTYTGEPEWVLSQAAANTLIIRTVPVLSAPTARSLRLVCDWDITDTVIVSNAGEAPLRLDAPRFADGTRGFSLLSPTSFPVTVLPGASLPFILRYTASAAGTVRDTLLVASNDTSALYNPWRLALEARTDSAGLSADLAQLVFPDVLSCTGSASDSTITLRNTGSIALTLALPAIDTSVFSLLTPPATSFPRTLPPGASLTLTLRASPPLDGGTVTGTLHIEGEVEGCVRALDIPLRVTGHTVALRMADTVLAGSLRCASDLRDTTLVIENTGTLAVTLAAPVPAASEVFVTAPAFPLTIPAGESRVITLRYAPPAAGVHIVTLRFAEDPCATERVLTVIGRRDSLALDAAALDFGVLRASQFPATGRIVIRNTGVVPVDLTAAFFGASAPFSVIGGIPAALAPGDSAVVDVRVDDPGTDGPMRDTLDVVHLPSCTPLRVPVRGTRIDAAVVLALDTLAAEPGEPVDIRIHLRSGVDPRLLGVTGIRATVRLRTAVLAPRGALTTRTQGDDRLVDVTLAVTGPAPSVLATLPFTATLGDVEATDLALEDVQPLGAALDITTVPGRFTLLGICRDGGVRLFSDERPAGITGVHPQPFNPVAVISYSLIEEGRTSLHVIDGLGRIVATLFDDVRPAGTATVRFDATGLASGVYHCVLVTPSRLYTHPMVLAR